MSNSSQFNKFRWIISFIGAMAVLLFAFQNCGGPKSTSSDSASSLSQNSPVNCTNSTTYIDCSQVIRVPKTFLENGCAQFACQGDNPVEDNNPGLVLCNPAAGFPTCNVGEQLVATEENNCLQLTCEMASVGANESFVRGLYTTWFDRQPDQAGLDYWVTELGTKTQERVQLDFLGGTQNVAPHFDQDFIVNNRPQVFITVHETGDESGPRDLPQWFVDATTPEPPGGNDGGDDGGGTTPNPMACSARYFQGGAFQPRRSFAAGETAIVPVVVAGISFVPDNTGAGNHRFQISAACNMQRRRCNSNRRWTTINGEDATPTGETRGRSLSIDGGNLELQLNDLAMGACYDAVELRSVSTCETDPNNCISNFNTASVFDRDDWVARVTFVRSVYTEWFGRSADSAGLNYWVHYSKTRSQDQIRCDIITGAQNTDPHRDQDYVLQNKVNDFANEVPNCQRPSYFP